MLTREKSQGESDKRKEVAKLLDQLEQLKDANRSLETKIVTLKANEEALEERV